MSYSSGMWDGKRRVAVPPLSADVLARNLGLEWKRQRRIVRSLNRRLTRLGEPPDADQKPEPRSRKRARARLEHRLVKHEHRLKAAAEGRWWWA